MDKAFDRFMHRFGLPVSRMAASSKSIEKYRGKLPDQLLQYWEKYGFCGFKDGLFWIVNPDDYEDALDAWIGDTPAMEEDAYYVIARSAFGALYLWGKKTGYKYKVNSSIGWIIDMGDSSEKIAIEGENKVLGSFFYCQQPKYTDEVDQNDLALFDRCIEKIRPAQRRRMLWLCPGLICRW